MKKTIFIILLATSFNAATAKKPDVIKIKTVYKRSKKIWGVYTLNKQDWSHGKRKHRVGAKDDHVLLRKKGKLVFIEPDFKEGLLSYGVKTIPYVKKGKKRIEVQDENLEELNFKSNPILREDKSYRTVSFKCHNKWSKIECEQTLAEGSKAELALDNES